MKKLILITMLSLAAFAQPLGNVKFSTTGRGEGTLLEAQRVDAGHVRLQMAWKGYAPNKGEIVLTSAEVQRLSENLSKALAAPRSAKPVDFPVASSGGVSLILQDQWDEEGGITYLILKPAGSKAWKDWVIAQVNLKPAETEAFRKLLAKMR